MFRVGLLWLERVPRNLDLSLEGGSSRTLRIVWPHESFIPGV